MSEDGALAEIRRIVEVGLTAVNGRLDVIIERLEQQDRRADQHEAQLATLDTRLDTVEKTAVTREDMKLVADRAGQSVTQADMADRQRHILGWTTVIVTAIGILVGAAVTVAVGVLS